MATAKLTLSADERVIREAKRLAKVNHTSVSAMFARYVEGVLENQAGAAEGLGPLTRRASGMIKGPKGKSDRRLLEEALIDKHGARS